MDRSCLGNICVRRDISTSSASTCAGNDSTTGGRSSHLFLLRPDQVQLLDVNTSEGATLDMATFDLPFRKIYMPQIQAIPRLWLSVAIKSQ